MTSRHAASKPLVFPSTLLFLRNIFRILYITFILIRICEVVGKILEAEYRIRCPGTDQKYHRGHDLSVLGGISWPCSFPLVSVKLILFHAFGSHFIHVLSVFSSSSSCMMLKLRKLSNQDSLFAFFYSHTTCQMEINSVFWTFLRNSSLFLETSARI